MGLENLLKWPGEILQRKRRSTRHIQPVLTYSLEQNRINRLLIERAQVMLFNSGFEKTNWHHAVANSINHSSCRVNPESKTIYKQCFGEPLDIETLRILECTAYHLVDEAICQRKPGTSNLDYRAISHLSVGYSITTNCSWTWKPRIQIMHYT